MLMAAAGVGAVILLVGGITLAVTSGGDESANAGDTTTTSVESETSTTATTTSTPAQPAGHSYTIADYIRENKLTETPIHQGNAGAPVFTMPTPPGWTAAGTRTPAWAYSAIVNDAISPTDPPSVVSLISKLVGAVDADKLLDLAPNELQNLADYESVSGPTRGTLGGFPAVSLAGFYVKEGTRRAITQTTAAVQTPGSFFVLQINADSLSRDMNALTDINKVIQREATVTP